MIYRLIARTALLVCLVMGFAPTNQPVVAQQPESPFSVHELARRLEATERRLLQTENQLEALRDQQPGRTWPTTTVKSTASPPRVVSHPGKARADSHSVECCPDCGKTVCQGVPHLCGICLEQLSWNKAGGWRVVPFGRLRGDGIYSTAPYTNDAVVVFLNPNNPGVDEDSTSITAKQSQINFAITGPNYGGWDTGGLILINFMGAQPLRNFSGANIVLAYGEIKDEQWRFSFGRMLDLFGPIAPRSVNQIEQRGAGNIGIYRGAFNVDRYVTVSDVQKWTFSSRISQPDISDYAAIPQINGQNNGWPNLEARVGVELGPAFESGRPVEIGVSGVIGEVQAVLPAIAGGLIFPGAGEVEQTRGICLDAQFRGEKMGLRGEVWWGQTAGTYFVATLQTINPETNQGIEAVGGWAEIYYNLNPCLTTHIGYAIDDPRNSDLGFLDRNNGPGQIGYNEVLWWNLLYNVTDNFELGFEVSHRQTNFLDPNSNSDSTLFHFSSTFSF